MAVSMISCCLNLTPPASSTSESSHSKESHLPWPKTQRQRSWESRCLVGAAAVIVGLEMMIGNGIGEQQAAALAWDSRQPSTAASEPVLMRGQRWSDKRICPAWRVNSLETIVPENLPRPFTRRRWEAVEFPEAPSQSSSQRTSSSEIVTTPNKCFSL